MPAVGLWRYSPEELSANLATAGARAGDADARVEAAVRNNGSGEMGRLAVGQRHLFYAQPGSNVLPIVTGAGAAVCVVGAILGRTKIGIALVLIGGGVALGALSWLAAFRA